ncbi:MAG: ABC transporter permease subunit [Treponema sp.]|nr:ABC transporter permease subunit [Treponema sp.]
MWATVAALAAITAYGLFTLDSNGVNIPDAIGETLRNFRTIFLHPESRRLSAGAAAWELLLTVAQAILITLFSGLVSLGLGLLGARNLAPKPLTQAIKAVIAVVRAIPSILWVLIFAVAAGLGSTAAVLGLSMHSIGYLTKAYAESFESLDYGVVEALQAVGANWWQIVFQAVLPSSSTYLLSWTFLRFEMNFTNVVAMGAAAGAAGIGFDLFMASSLYFDLGELGLITYFVLAFAILLEIVAIRVKAVLKER